MFAVVAWGKAVDKASPSASESESAKPVPANSWKDEVYACHYDFECPEPMRCRDKACSWAA